MTMLFAIFLISTITTFFLLRHFPIPKQPQITSRKITPREISLVGGMVFLIGIASIAMIFVFLNEAYAPCMWPRRTCHEKIFKAIDEARYWRHLYAWVAFCPLTTLMGLRLYKIGIKLRELQP
jgi:hypothetical protein